MTRHTGLGRHSGSKEAVGDPLDGLVNLFDIGIVLAVAFLIAGLGLALNQSTHHLQQRTSTAGNTPTAQRAPTAQHTQTLPSPSSSAPVASGHGQLVGSVYRLAGGQLVYVRRQR
jgi:hypothetical protein